MRVLICGGRDYSDERSFSLQMSAINEQYGPFTCVIHGAASGADAFAARYAARELIPVESYPADWRKHGRAAGPIRNEQMLREGRPDLVVAFPGGRGTANMVALARGSGVRVIEPA
ncbi:SLOG family protein [Brevundimonas sp.]|uniref:SLOG family protein n=1 Tax=Brevundimonas sp. TaxID=1871086 RepID=UPI0025C677FC|nr:SLOG family protein [Brevundimonas sp.]